MNDCERDEKFKADIAPLSAFLHPTDDIRLILDTVASEGAYVLKLSGGLRLEDRNISITLSSPKETIIHLENVNTDSPGNFLRGYHRHEKATKGEKEMRFWDHITFRFLDGELMEITPRDF